MSLSKSQPAFSMSVTCCLCDENGSSSSFVALGCNDRHACYGCTTNFLIAMADGLLPFSGVMCLAGCGARLDYDLIRPALSITSEEKNAYDQHAKTNKQTSSSSLSASSSSIIASSATASISRLSALASATSGSASLVYKRMLKYRLLALIDSVQFQQAIMSMDDFRFCSTPNCQGGGWFLPSCIPSSSFFSSLSSKISSFSASSYFVLRCLSFLCSKLRIFSPSSSPSCLVCSKSVSVDYDVHGVNVRESNQVKQWISGNTKTCSKCRAKIEKNGGCNHMTCSRCRHEFCWLCGQSWRGHVCSYKPPPPPFYQRPCFVIPVVVIIALACLAYSIYAFVTYVPPNIQLFVYDYGVPLLTFIMNQVIIIICFALTALSSKFLSQGLFSLNRRVPFLSCLPFSCFHPPAQTFISRRSYADRRIQNALFDTLAFTFLVLWAILCAHIYCYGHEFSFTHVIGQRGLFTQALCEIVVVAAVFTVVLLYQLGLLLYEATVSAYNAVLTSKFVVRLSRKAGQLASYVSTVRGKISKAWRVCARVWGSASNSTSTPSTPSSSKNSHRYRDTSTSRQNNSKKSLAKASKKIKTV